MSNSEMFNISLEKQLYFWSPEAAYCHVCSYPFPLSADLKNQILNLVMCNIFGGKNIKKKLQVLVYPM